MKPVKYKPYSKTSYLPSYIGISSSTSSSELMHILQLFEKEVARLNLILEHKDKIIAALTSENEHLQGVMNGQKDALFGRSTEKQKTSVEQHEVEEHSTQETVALPKKSSIKRRGAKPGHKGHGRKIPPLPEIEVLHEIPQEQSCCPHCGDSLGKTCLTEESFEVDYEVKFVLKKHVRKRAVRTCTCSGPKFITAPKPPQVIPKGLFSHGFLAHVLIMKFLFQIPLHRCLQMMQMQGLDVNASTFVGIFQTLHELLTPLYDRLIEVSRKANQWHVDETGWKNFVQVENKQNFNWWLWIFASKQTVVYVLDSSRSSSVPISHFGPDAEGMVNSDRYSAYRKLTTHQEGLTNSWCWAHFRRDFINAGKAYIFLKSWADLWVSRIAHIYHLQAHRLSVLEDSAVASGQAQASLEKALGLFLQQIEQELLSPDLHPRQHQILKNARKNWEGLTVFVTHPEVPMDNNTAERLLRPVALGRKNYYGSHATWSGQFTAVCMSILQTAVKHGLNAEVYVRYIFDVYAQHQGPPSDLDSLLPWNLSEEVIHTYNMRSGGSS